MKKERKKHPVLRTILIVLAVVIVVGIAVGYSKFKKTYNKMMDESTAGQSELIGTEAPDFTLKDTDGNEFTLSEVLKEKDAVVLNVFATWCGPCENEFPEFEAVYQEQGDRLGMLAVSDDSLDSEEAIAEYKAGHGLSFPMAYSREALSFIPKTGYPTTVIVDRNGKVMFCQSGTFASREALEGVIGEFTGDDYAGKPVYLYTLGAYSKDEYIPGVTLKAVSDDGSEETVASGDDGLAYIQTNEPHTYTVEITEMPEGYSKPSGTVTAGPRSGYSLFSIK